ncbi:MaoC/PaaZ C-terminal domain-containing protein [Terricaulis sp.]|uniref:MaoC/PaaZ C-terminal domain-containing protein n=1 Tax=Terricaulis sp. TaxID=2768686 RepID=UPI0037836A0C
MRGFVFEAGASLPELVRGPITRGTLALYAGASSDHVMLHIDSDFAKAAGMGDVFAHGMLSMAYLAQFVTQVTSPESVLNWSVRFLAITPVHATVRCSGEVVELYQEQGEARARLRIRTTIDSGVKTLEGEAVVALSRGTP